jgi:uncharacterized protein (TIGR00106 family)
MYSDAIGALFLIISLTQLTEGSWDEVMKVIGQAHAMLHSKGIVRIHTDIRVGTRTDKKETAASKVSVVQEMLAQDTM